jgi:hypothetical protein
VPLIVEDSEPSRRIVTVHKLAAVFILISFSSHADHLAPQERLLATPEGAFIEIQLRDKSKLHGHLDKVERHGFLITTPTANHLDLVQRRIAISDLKFVKLVRDSRDYESDSLRTRKIAAAIVLILVFVVAPIAATVGEH